MAKITGMVHVDSERRIAGEPESPRMQGHRVHFGRDRIVMYEDVIRYGDGTVKVLAYRRPGQETVQGDAVVLIHCYKPYDAIVSDVIDNATCHGWYTGDHPLSPAP